jgi:hypothetical protein
MKGESEIMVAIGGYFVSALFIYVGISANTIISGAFILGGIAGLVLTTAGIFGLTKLR